MILSFRTDWSGKIVQTQIRLLLEEQTLLLEEQSDQGLHYLLFHLHLFDEIPYALASLFKFYVDYSKVFLASQNLGTLWYNRLTSLPIPCRVVFLDSELSGPYLHRAVASNTVAAWKHIKCISINS